MTTQPRPLGQPLGAPVSQGVTELAVTVSQVLEQARADRFRAGEYELAIRAAVRLLNEDAIVPALRVLKAALAAGEKR